MASSPSENWPMQLKTFMRRRRLAHDNFQNQTFGWSTHLILNNKHPANISSHVFTLMHSYKIKSSLKASSLCQNIGKLTRGKKERIKDKDGKKEKRLPSQPWKKKKKILIQKTTTTTQKTTKTGERNNNNAQDRKQDLCPHTQKRRRCHDSAEPGPHKQVKQGKRHNIYGNSTNGRTGWEANRVGGGGGGGGGRKGRRDWVLAV